MRGALKTTFRDPGCYRMGKSRIESQGEQAKGNLRAIKGILGGSGVPWNELENREFAIRAMLRQANRERSFSARIGQAFANSLLLVDSRLGLLSER